MTSLYDSGYNISWPALHFFIDPCNIISDPDGADSGFLVPPEKDPLCDCLHIQAGASCQYWEPSSFVNIQYCFSSHGSVIRHAEPFLGRQKNLSYGGEFHASLPLPLRRSDGHSLIDLHRVGGHHLSVQPLGERRRQAVFPEAVGPTTHINGNFSLLIIESCQIVFRFPAFSA